MHNTVEYIDQNVVVIAKNFNVAIMSPVWLHKNEIFTEEELQGATCLPVTVEIRRNEFNFIIVPDRMQFSINTDYEDVKGLISSKLNKIITLLPHTPFTAAGLNFTYHVTPTDGDLYALSHSLFCNEKARLFDDLDSNDVRYGGYISKNILDTRLRLDAKPINIKKGDEIEEKLQFSFNFNINISPNDDCAVIIELFNKWDDANKITREIMDKINQ